MRIVICGSMAFASDMIEIKNRLESMGHVCELPIGTDEYAVNGKAAYGNLEGAQRKIHFNLIKEHYWKIQDCQAILVVNKKKGGIENYIGGNTFLEMGFAHVLERAVYLLNEVPDIPLIRQEVEAMQPIVLWGDLTKVV